MLCGTILIFIQAKLSFNLKLHCFYNSVFGLCEMQHVCRRARIFNKLKIKKKSLMLLVKY